MDNDSQKKLSLPATPGARKPHRWISRSWYLLAFPLILFIAIPLLAMFLRLSPNDFWQSLRQDQVLTAIRISLFTSISTVGISLLLGTPVAYLLSRRRSRLTRIIDTLIDLPIVLPPAVAGVALLLAFGRRGILGIWLASLGITLPFTTAAVIMAQTFIAAPLYIKAATLGFDAVDCELRKAAALDGANRWQTFRYVMFPMARASILSGSLMTWARAMGEFGATIIFAGNFPGRTQTMPLAIYIGFEIDMNVALTLSVILISFAFLTLILVKGFLHKKVETGMEEY
ncbi:MAG: ABC transporter permease [Anaerolineaceae bacterium]|jgi:molybdate transport system permease protein